MSENDLTDPGTRADLIIQMVKEADAAGDTESVDMWLNVAAIHNESLPPIREPEYKPRCGPWLERDGFHYCEKCGRLDPLDFIEDD